MAIMTMQDIKSRELREKDPNANTKIYFEIWATALRPRLQTEGFPLCPPRTFHKGTSTKELQLTNRSTQLQLSHTSAQEGRHKAKHKAKKKIATWWSNDHKQYLVIIKITNQTLLTDKILEDRFAMDSLSMWVK